MRRLVKVTVLTALLGWLARLEWRSRLQQATAVGLGQRIGHEISAHRDTSSHGIVLIGSPPPLDFEPPKLADEPLWQPPSAQQYFGVPVYDPQHIISTTL